MDSLTKKLTTLLALQPAAYFLVSIVRHRGEGMGSSYVETWTLDRDLYIWRVRWENPYAAFGTPYQFLDCGLAGTMEEAVAAGEATARQRARERRQRLAS